MDFTFLAKSYLLFVEIETPQTNKWDSMDTSSSAYCTSAIVYWSAGAWDMEVISLLLLLVGIKRYLSCAAAALSFFRLWVRSNSYKKSPS